MDVDTFASRRSNSADILAARDALAGRVADISAALKLTELKNRASQATISFDSICDKAVLVMDPTITMLTDPNSWLWWHRCAKRSRVHSGGLPSAGLPERVARLQDQSEVWAGKSPWRLTQTKPLGFLAPFLPSLQPWLCSWWKVRFLLQGWVGAARQGSGKRPFVGMLPLELFKGITGHSEIWTLEGMTGNEYAKLPRPSWQFSIIFPDGAKIMADVPAYGWSCAGTGHASTDLIATNSFSKLAPPESSPYPRTLGPQVGAGTISHRPKLRIVPRAGGFCVDGGVGIFPRRNAMEEIQHVVDTSDQIGLGPPTKRLSKYSYRVWCTHTHRDTVLFNRLFSHQWTVITNQLFLPIFGSWLKVVGWRDLLESSPKFHLGSLETPGYCYMSWWQKRKRKSTDQTLLVQPMTS